MDAKQGDRDAVLAVVSGINDCWRAKRYDGLGELLADDVVLAAPGFASRVRGRGAYVQSYRDYDAAATTLAFSSGEPQVDVFGDTSVVVYPFDVTYELDGKPYHDRGHDILALTRSGGDWKVVWRTMQAAPVEAE
jgi:ketosteroid isomerase-like protein